jgi:hypothetical protein
LQWARRSTPNKVTANIRDSILQSLEDRGGVDYLNNLEPEEFNKLLARVIPKDVKIDVDDKVIWIVRDLTGRTKPKPKTIDVEGTREDK